MLQLDILHRFYFGGGKEDYSSETGLDIGLLLFVYEIQFFLDSSYFFNFFHLFLDMILMFHTSVITCKHIKSKLHGFVNIKVAIFIGLPR